MEDKNGNNSNFNNSNFDEIARIAETTAAEAISKITDIAKSADAVGLFVALFANMSFRPAEYTSEITLGDIPAKLELLAFYLYPFFGVASKKEATISPLNTQACWEALDKLFISRNQNLIFSKSQPSGSEQIDNLLRSLRIHTEIVRGSAYPEQTREEILSVQGQFDAWFTQKVGISPTRAVDLLWGIIITQEEAATDFIKDVLENARLFGELWNLANDKPTEKRSELERRILGICANKEVAMSFGYVMRLNELAPLRLPVKSSKVSSLDPPPSENEWEAICSLIGLTAEKRENIIDPLEVRHRPLFVLPNNSVLLGDISNALDCLWERFEAIAKSDQNFYDSRYQRKKADWLEGKVFECLKQIFPSAYVKKRLSYPDPDKTDDSTAELDFAVLWPPFIVLIEAKARQFRIESQLGDPCRLRSDIKANIADAYEQGKRALRYIDSTDNPEFTEIGTGKKLTFKRDSIRRIYLLTVSQHHFAGLVNQLAELRDLGLFKSGEYPFSLCIADLEIISEFCNGPDVFLHFIDRRMVALHGQTRFVTDELDFFGAYLSCRLQAERIWQSQEGPVDSVSLSGWSEKFDQLMEYRRGDRESAPTLEIEIPPEIKNILLELRKRTDDPGARWIAFALLSMSDKALGLIAKNLKEIRFATMTPGKFRRMSYQESDTVISIVASLDLPSEMLRTRTASLAIMEKYRHKVSKSIGIGIMLSNHREAFDCAIWVEGLWRYDENVENALKTEPPLMPANGQKLPGRNDPCLCGSGKKFKKCCLPRIKNRK